MTSVFRTVAMAKGYNTSQITVPTIMMIAKGSVTKPLASGQCHHRKVVAIGSPISDPTNRHALHLVSDTASMEVMEIVRPSARSHDATTCECEDGAACHPR